jgi:hypothetical protein
MSPRVIKITVLAIVAIVVVIGVRHYFSPGEVVKRKLIATIEAFEEERLLAVMSGISRSYSDPWGFDYETLAGHLNMTMETYDDLDVDSLIGKPVVGEDEVRIDIEFILWGRYEGTKGYIIGSITEPCTATLLWRKETPGWRFASTEELDIPELREELDSRRLER